MNAILGSKDGAACGFAMQRYSGSIPHFHCQPKSQCRTNKMSEGLKKKEEITIRILKENKKANTHKAKKSQNYQK